MRASSIFFATSSFLAGKSTSFMYRSRSCSLVLASARALDCARSVFGSNSPQTNPAGRLVCCRSTDKCKRALKGELIVWLDFGRIRQESTPRRIRWESGKASQFHLGAGAGALGFAVGVREQPESPQNAMAQTIRATLPYAT